MASEWIPVTERLPEACACVIAAYGRSEVGELTWWGPVEGWSDQEGYKYQDVTHWMPLPDPPGAETC